MDPLTMLALATLAAAAAAGTKKKNAIVRVFGFDLLLDDASLTQGRFSDHTDIRSGPPTLELKGTPTPGDIAQLEELARQGVVGPPPVILFDGKRYPLSEIWGWETGWPRRQPDMTRHYSLAEQPFSMWGLPVQTGLDDWYESKVMDDLYGEVVRATLEVWGKHPDFDPVRLIGTHSEWMLPGDVSGWSSGNSDETIVASVYHEYASAPKNPFTYDQRQRGEFGEHQTWQRVQELLDERLGERAPNFESINAGVSLWYGPSVATD